MMITEEDVDLFSEKLAGATRRVVEDLEVGDVYHEEPFSDQLCGRLKESLHDFTTPNLRWQTDISRAGEGIARLRARTLTKTKEEPEFGADIVMTLDIKTDAYEVQKGFLAQAKRLEKGERLSNADHRKLLGQCERMLSLTPSSMVFLYGANGVHVVPATAVLAISTNDLWQIITYDIGILYRDFAICWYGDPRLKATDHLSLEGLRATIEAPVALRFKGRSKD